MSNPALRRILPAVLALALAASAALAVVARHAGADPQHTLSVTDSLVMSGASALVEAVIDPPAAAEVIVAAEFEAGTNDPDAGDDRTDSHATPDVWCVVPAGSSSCTLELQNASSGATSELLRTWIASGDAYIDTQEAPTTAGSSPGCAEEPDATEATRVVVLGQGQQPYPEPAPPPAGFDADPGTCETAAPPTPTATATPSETGTPSETPTPDPTSTATPTESPTPDPTPTETEPPTHEPSPTTSPTRRPDPITVGEAPYDGMSRTATCETSPALSPPDGCTAASNADPGAGQMNVRAVVDTAAESAQSPLEAKAAAAMEHTFTTRSSSAFTLTFRFRLDHASLERTAASPTFTSPRGNLEVFADVRTACGETSASTYALDEESEVRNRIVTLVVRVEPYYGDCDGHREVSLSAGVVATTWSYPGMRGRSEVAARATLLSVVGEFPR